MRKPIVALIFAGLALAWVVLFGAGIHPADRNATLLILGGISFLYWPFRTGQTAPPLRTWHGVALAALLCYFIFQVTPLSRTFLETISPARASLTDDLSKAVSNVYKAPISITPDASLYGFFGFLGYLATFLLIRDLAWRFTETKNWIVVLPIIGVAFIEAIIGAVQSFGTTATVAGSYPDRDHFSAFLETTLPLSLVFGYYAFRQHRLQSGDSARPVLLACAMWATSVLSFIVILQSGSPASRLVLPASLAVTAALIVRPFLKTPRLKLAGGGTLLVGLITFLILFPPFQYMDFLSDLAASDKSPSEQLGLWKETLPMLSEFRWFGTGWGGFESAFLKYQGSVAGLRIDSPHNDYLRYLVEIGLCGAILLAVALFGVIRSVVRGALFLENESRRCLAIAGAGCFVAIALRSAVDSNLSVPANAFVFAWLSGVVCANGLE